MASTNRTSTNWTKRRQGTPRAEGPRLPTTSYAILGVLTFGDMSGYDLAKFVENSVGFFWTPAKSQIYAELRRLVSVGYATEHEVEQRDRPDKRVYRVTLEGQRALRRWLEQADIEPDTIRSAFLLQVFFGHHVSRETLLSRVQEYRRQAKDRLTAFRQIERHIKGKPELLYPYLTLRSGLAHVRASITWADDVIRELGGRDES